jgi:hypothetical protein
MAAPPTAPWQDNATGQPELAGSVLLAVEGGGKVSFTDCHIHCIDPRNVVRPLIHAKAGRRQVRSSRQSE